MIKLYNTLSRKKEDFKPIKKGKVGMYSCGPTVYWYQHIGNLRTYIFSDVLRRVLQYHGYNVEHVMNVTDVGHLTSDADEGEDKMEKAAKKEGKKASEIANYYFDVFVGDLHKLKILEPKIWTKATDHIKEQIDLIQKLEDKGYTYQTSDGIYFDSSKFKDYSKLGKLKIESLEAGKRVSLGEKRHVSDFALWKFCKLGDRQQEWDSPWGVGFPGWHIECSAMSMKYLGESFDIHTGGEDHVQIHHTNEIAQSEAATGKKFVNYWLHGAFLLNKGEKVSKSTGGLYTISELEEIGYEPLAYRYMNLLTHYRKPLNFSLDHLEAAKNAYERLRRKIIELKGMKHKGSDRTKEFEKKFSDVVNDDLNMPEALQVLWEVIDDFDFDPRKKIILLEKFDKILGLGISDMEEEKVEIPKEIMEMVEKREKLRELKNFAEADVLRNKIKARGYVIEDTESGIRVKRF